MFSLNYIMNRTSTAAKIYLTPAYNFADTYEVSKRVERYPKVM